MRAESVSLSRVSNPSAWTEAPKPQRWACTFKWLNAWSCWICKDQTDLGVSYKKSGYLWTCALNWKHEQEWKSIVVGQMVFWEVAMYSFHGNLLSKWFTANDVWLMYKFQLQLTPAHAPGCSLSPTCTQHTYLPFKYTQTSLFRFVFAKENTTHITWSLLMGPLFLSSGMLQMNIFPL